jgi:amino acid transporter
MKLLLNLIGCIIVLGFWLGAVYFYFLYNGTTTKMQLGIVIMVIMVIFMNIIYCLGIKFLTKGILKPQIYDYILTIFFGHFGCFWVREQIFEKLSNKKQVSDNCIQN